MELSAAQKGICGSKRGERVLGVSQCICIRCMFVTNGYISSVRICCGFAFCLAFLSLRNAVDGTVTATQII